MKLAKLAPALLLAVSVTADTVTLTPVADTAIFSLNPENNYGGLSTIPVGPIAKPNQVGRALLKFDIAAALPAGAVVTNVTLTVQVAKQSISGPADKVGLHRLLTDWGEGTKSEESHGAEATAGEANWAWRRLGTASWSTPGAIAPSDMVQAESGWVNWKQPGSYTFVTLPAMVADVQRWLDSPGQNQGWLLKSQTESTQGAAKRMVSREGPAEQRPQLVIGYSLPAPFEPTLQSPKLTGDTLELRYFLEAGNLYELRAFVDLGRTNFTVLTNHAVKFTAFEAGYSEPASEAQRFYRLVITGQID